MKWCKPKKEETTDDRAAQNRLRGRLNKATEKIEPEPDGLNKIRGRTDKKKGKKDK